MNFHQEHPFYGYEIYRDQEHEFIEKILQKYRNFPVSEDLKKRIWEDLQREKHLGRVTIPFKVVMRKDPSGKFPNRIEIILDTKV